MVIEKLFSFIGAHIRVDPAIKLLSRPTPDSAHTSEIAIAKLHGDVESGKIILPTWNKLISPEISESWKLAFNVLKSANHIRIMGYSLPETDAYVKYLVKAAVLSSTNLKSIDIICLDNDQIIEKRYRNFVDFHKMRFISGDVIDYFDTIREAILDARTFTEDPFNFSVLEQAHESFISEYL